MRDFVQAVGMTANLARQGEDRSVEDTLHHSDVMGWRGRLATRGIGVVRSSEEVDHR